MPTPVSALLHAATMVTAGVYLLMRSSPILEYSPTMLLVCLWLGGITTSVAGLIAIVSNDIKRVIALSTMSQMARKYIIFYFYYIFRNQAIYEKPHFFIIFILKIYLIQHLKEIFIYLKDIILFIKI